MKVRENGFVALIPRYGLEHIVYLDAPPAPAAGQTAAAIPENAAPVEEWAMSEDGQVLRGATSGREIRVFDPVRVSVRDGAPLQCAVLPPTSRHRTMHMFY